MKRKVEQKLLEWKSSPNKKPIILKGCRQCGKTYSVVHFAQEHYEQMLYLNFMDRPELYQVFSGALTMDNILMRLSALYPAIPMVPGKTCIVMDEIQECPRARMALKPMSVDGRFDVLCTGSLLGVNGYRSPLDPDSGQKADIPVGYEDIIDMCPMDFEEFLWATGHSAESLDVIRNAYQSEQPVDDFWHNHFREQLLQYTVVGGMPEAVDTFCRNHDMGQVLHVQRRILQDYRADMLKYASQEDKPRIAACFNSIPLQLSRENKKFMYSTIRTGGRARDYSGSLQWIEDAGIIRRCKNLQITELPLDGNAMEDCFKIYMADTGLLVSMLEDGTQGDILSGNLLGYKGAIFENLLADIFGKMERKLYYFHKDSGLEIDFVIRYKGKCTLVECKAANGRAKSMTTIMNHPEKYHVEQAVKLADCNVGRNGNVLSLPLYMAFLLTER